VMEWGRLLHNGISEQYTEQSEYILQDPEYSKDYKNMGVAPHKIRAASQSNIPSKASIYCKILSTRRTTKIVLWRRRVLRHLRAIYRT